LKDDRYYIVYMLDCIANVEEDTAGGKESFLARRTFRDAVMRNLQILAESSIRVSETTKAEFPEVDWQELRKFRHVAVHDYTGIDYELVWRIVSEHLPPLKQQLERILQTKNAG
jgi:uncharacterized protein with HEPN domain